MNIDKGGKVIIYHMGNLFDTQPETLRDDNGDGSVDVFSKGSKTFVREVDGQRFRPVFEQADKKYAEMMERSESPIEKYIK